jgi:hypothetical protein
MHNSLRKLQASPFLIVFSFRVDVDTAFLLSHPTASMTSVGDDSIAVDD